MLIGTYAHSLDTKGRLFIPSKWRESIGDTLIVMQGILESGQGPCLFAMSVADWEQFSARLSQLPMTDMAGQAVRRRLYANASACEIDRQGRILLPQTLRDIAGIGETAVLIGVGNRIEIWEPGNLDAHFNRMDSEYASALEHLSQLGI